MTKSVFVWMLALILAVAVVVVAAQQSGSAVPPPWAYGFATPPNAPAANAPAANPAPRGGGGGGGAQPADTPRQLPGSKMSFTLAQVRDGFGPADWFPEDHPAMPEMVAHGNRERQINACGLCHYPNGKGRPENAGISGLPYAYFVQQMLDFKNDTRKSADSRKANTARMAAF